MSNLQTPLKNVSPFLKELYIYEINLLRNIASMRNEGWLNELCDFLKQSLLRTYRATEEHLAKRNEKPPQEWNVFLQARIPFTEAAGKVIFDYWNNCVRTLLAKSRKRHRRLREQELLASSAPAIGILSNDQTDAVLSLVQLHEERTIKISEIIEKIKHTADPIARADLMTVKFYYEVFEPFAITYITDFFTELDSMICANKKNAYPH